MKGTEAPVLSRLLGGIVLTRYGEGEMFHAGILYKIEKDEDGDEDIFFLTVTRDKGSGRFQTVFPGGKSEDGDDRKGELPEETLMREFVEETGLTISDGAHRVVRFELEDGQAKFFSVVEHVSGNFGGTFDNAVTAAKYLPYGRLRGAIHWTHRSALFAAVSYLYGSDPEFYRVYHARYGYPGPKVA